MWIFLNQCFSFQLSKFWRWQTKCEILDFIFSFLSRTQNAIRFWESGFKLDEHFQFLRLMTHIFVLLSGFRFFKEPPEQNKDNMSHIYASSVSHINIKPRLPKSAHFHHFTFTISPILKPRKFEMIWPSMTRCDQWSHLVHKGGFGGPNVPKILPCPLPGFFWRISPQCP